MPKLTKEFKQAIEQIPVQKLRKLLIQAAAKNRELFDIINLQYVSGKNAEKELFQEAKDLVHGEILFFSDRGVAQKCYAKAISKAVAHINQYAKVTKNKPGEAALLLVLLEEVFENYSNELGTCWTVFDSRLAITTNRLYNLVTKKLHEDYLIEYKEPLNRFLEILHSRSNHLNYIYDMPKSLGR